jgi:hAT family C-terminal dimerisation region
MFNHFDGDKINQEKVIKRLEFICTDSMRLAFILNPQYAAKGFYFGDDQTDFMGLAREFALRISPATAQKVHEEMIAFVTKMSTLPPKRAEIIFPMSAKNYWSTIGRRDYPALYEVAKPIVEMICSSAIAERIWSTFKFIHSRLRNRLTDERVRKLVFIYTNCVMLDEKDKNDYILDEGALLSAIDCDDNVENDQ